MAAKTNTYRQSAEYLNKIKQIYEGKAVPVIPYYHILVCPQTSYVETMRQFGASNIDDFVHMVNDQVSGVNYIAVIDYHECTGGVLKVPNAECTCRFSYYNGNNHPHGIDDSQKGQSYFVDVLKQLQEQYSDVSKPNNFYGFIKRNGGTEHAPLATLNNLINHINDSRMLANNNVILFPPVFTISGFFIEDMITEIALELRSKFPNSSIGFAQAYSIECIKEERSWDSTDDQNAIEMLRMQIDTNAVVTPIDVMEDIRNYKPE
jgi:hypothetical protein